MSVLLEYQYLEFSSVVLVSSCPQLLFEAAGFFEIGAGTHLRWAHVEYRSLEIQCLNKPDKLEELYIPS